MLTHNKLITFVAIAAIVTTIIAACAPPTPERIVETVVVTKEVPVEVVVTATPEVVEIEYWQYFFDARVDAMNRLIMQFEAENPDIHVKHVTFPYAEFNEKVAASVPAGVGPDVVTLYYGWLAMYVDAGYLVPLPEEHFPPEMIEKEFFPMVAERSKFLGKYWTIPTAVRTLALFWNKDLFVAAGLDPEKPPTTLDELVEMAKACTIRDAEGKLVQEGFALDKAAQLHHWFREVLTRQFGQVPQSEDFRKIQWNASEAGYKAWEWYLDLTTKHKLGDVAFFEGGTNAFLIGKACLHVDGSFRLGTIAKRAPDLNFGVAPLPVGPTGEKATFGSFWTHGLTTKAAADPRRMEAAIKFLKFITTYDAMKLWVKKVGELPARVEGATDPDIVEDPKLGPFAEQLPYAHATFFVDELADREGFIEAYEKVTLLGEDPRAALDVWVEKVQADFDEFWAKYE